MIRKYDAIHLIVALSTLLFSTNLLAQFKPSTEPTFSVDNQPWHLLSMVDQVNQNMRIYGYHDDERSKDSPPEQALHVHVSYDSQDVEEIHKSIRSVFQAAETEIVVNEPGFTLYRTYASKTTVPQMIFVTAVFEATSDDKIIIAQYVLKPKCENCIRLEKNWIERFRFATLNENESAILLDNGLVSVPLHPFVKTAERVRGTQLAQGWYPWMSECLTSTYTWVVTAGGTLFFFGTKLVLGMMGMNGPCGANMAVCPCHLKAMGFR